MHMPTDAEVRAAAVQQGLLARETDELPEATRRTVIQQLLDDQKDQAQKPPPGGTQELVTRTVTAVDDGHLIVEVWHKKKDR